jgi:hypothetical protein
MARPLCQALIGLALMALSACSEPLPAAPERSSTEAPRAALRLRFALPKALRAAVGRVVARLEAPDQDPVEGELEISPLGPAVGRLGALLPGTDRVLTVSGYDVLGTPIFVGQTTGITIAAGDTVAVEVALRLVGPWAPVNG